MAKWLPILVTSWLVMIVGGSRDLHSRAYEQSSRGAESSISSYRTLLDRYCATCHNQRLETAGLALDTMDLSRVGENAEVWEKVVRKLRAGIMPPAGRPRPDRLASEGLATWLEGELDRVAITRPDPGRTEPFRRLNRAEYANAIRDLLALDVDLTSILPSDASNYGFDTNADVLKFSEAVLERYLSAAAEISRMAVGSRASDVATAVFRVPEDIRQYEHVPGLPFGTRGGLVIRHHFPQDSDYQITVELVCRKQFASCEGSFRFPDAHQLELLVDGHRIQLWTLDTDFGAPFLNPSGQVASSSFANTKFEVRVPVKAGPRDIGVTFPRLPSFEEVGSIRRRFLRPMIGSAQQIYQPFVDKVTIVGPFGASGPGNTATRRRLFMCYPARPSEEATCARTILATVARRAYRRPVTDADVQGLLAFYESGRKERGFEAGIELALRRLLVSPEFLVRGEAEPAKAPRDGIFRISDLELASRLSFFLWSSIPDDELLDLASQGRLREPAVLERQIRRLIADPRSEALARNFAGQWLHLRNLDTTEPDLFIYPDFDNTLRQSMRRETELFFDSVMRENRSAVELLTAHYTFLNERLARHYGISNVKGSHFRRVTLGDDSPRRGLLGHGSILTVTSRPNRSSPVLRGAWFWENLLGTPPPPPPPNVPTLSEANPKRRSAKASSVRDRLTQHRKNPPCSTCHAFIDPPGFALENFDGVGRWRDVDDSFQPIDASGVLPDGTKFSGLDEFRRVLLRRPEDFVIALTAKLLTYALGRGLEYYDMPTVRRIVREAAPSHYQLSDLIAGIAMSPALLLKRVEEPPNVTATVSRR